MGYKGNINGKDVFSDKDIASIVGSKITFTDGSYCNVSTGEVVNRGSGYISIGRDSENRLNVKTTKGPLTFKLQGLEIRGCTADVHVEVQNRSNIEVSVDGFESDVEEIKVYEELGKLVIENSSNDFSISHVNIDNIESSVVVGYNSHLSGVNINSRTKSDGGIWEFIKSLFGGPERSDSTMHSSGRGVKISNSVVSFGKNKAQLPKIVVKLPAGYPLRIKGLNGSATIGDINAEVDISISSSATVNIGVVKNAYLSMSGSGKIFIEQMRGSMLQSKVTGSGSITVKSGQVDTVEAKISGSGNVNLEVNAMNASAKISGTGHINILSVTSEPKRKISGSGKIRIGNWN